MTDNKPKQVKKEPIPYPVLNKEEEVRIFKSLSHLSYKQAAKEYGLQLLSPESDERRLVSIVLSIANKIKKAPELWGLSQDAVDIVQDAMDSRSIKKNPKIRSDIAIQEESFRDKLDTMRDTVAEIITKKLEKYNTKKGIDDISIRDLKDLLATAIDKGRLLRGESTENITKLAKIDVDNLRPEDALKVIMKARDVLIESKK